MWFPTVVFADNASITPIFGRHDDLMLRILKVYEKDLSNTHLCGSHMVGEVLVVRPENKENDYPQTKCFNFLKF